MGFLDGLHDVATLLSLALTMVALAGCGAVVYYWKEGAREAYLEKHKTELSWFMLGVAVHFGFSFVDNFYWGITWGAHYIDREAAKPWFDSGVYPNIVFRQMGTALAAFCHLRAALSADSPIFKWLFYGSGASGIFLVVVLTLIKNGY